MDKVDHRPLIPLVQVGDHVILNHGGPWSGYAHTWKDDHALVKRLTERWGYVDLVMIENGEVREFPNVGHGEADWLSAMKKDTWTLPKPEVIYEAPQFQKKSLINPD